MFAELRGENLLTKESVNARLRVIDAPDRETLLMVDAAGRACTVGVGESNTFHAARVRVYRGAAITASTYRLDLSGRLVRDLIASLPKGAKQVYVTAELETKGTTELPPVLGYYRRVERQSEGYALRSATIGDLQSIEGLAIRQGSPVIRAEYSPGSPTLERLAFSTRIPKRETHVLTVPDLPSLAGFVVEIGDRVEEGQLIARYVDDAALEISRAQIETKGRWASELEKKMKLERAAHEAKLEAIRRRITGAREKLERVRYLVEAGAAPSVRLVEAEDALRGTQQTEREQLTAWTSRLNNLQSQARTARHSIKHAEAARSVRLEKQWVKAPVAGLVADVRLIEVTVKGVTLELLILQKAERSRLAVSIMK